MIIVLILTDLVTYQGILDCKTLVKGRIPSGLFYFLGVIRGLAGFGFHVAVSSEKMAKRRSVEKI